MHTIVNTSPHKRSLSTQDRDITLDKQNHNLTDSQTNIETYQTNKNIDQTLLKLAASEEENRRLKEELNQLRENTKKIITEKQELAEKLDEKIQSLEQLQTYLLEDHQLKNSQWSEIAQQHERQIQQKKKEIQYIKEQFRQELEHKENTIYELEDQLELERSKIQDLLKSDFFLSKKLRDLEDENVELQKELFESHTSLTNLKKSLEKEKLRDADWKEQSLLQNIENRVPTLQTQTDTIYAIQSMEQRIKKLQQINKDQKEKFKASMEYLVQYYQEQLDSAKEEIEDESQKPYRRLKNKVMSISQNLQNSGWIPLKDQIIQIANDQPPIGKHIRKKSENLDNQSEFSQKFFCAQPFIYKRNIEQVVDEEESCHQCSTNKIILAEQPQHSVRSSHEGFRIPTAVYLMAAGVLAVYATKRLFIGK